jgi:hypothetical protein
MTREPSPRDAADRSEFSLHVTAADLVAGRLCLQYWISPVPAALIGDHRLYQGRDAGVVLDSRRHVYRGCESGYRTSRTGEHVAGALRMGPAAWPELGFLTVLFAPFAYTRGLTGHLSEIDVRIYGLRIRHVQSRMI